MEQKKLTNKQLESRIKNAVIHVDRTKDTKEIFFDDRYMRFVYNEDAAFIGNVIYTTVINRYSSVGENSQYTCIRNIVDAALKYEEDIKVKNEKGEVFRSYSLLEKVLREKDEAASNMFFVIDKWLYNYETSIVLAPTDLISAPLFFSVYEKFAHSVSVNKVFMDEHKDGLTNKQYFYAIAEELRKVADDLTEQQMFEPLSDEERVKQNIDAMAQEETERTLENEHNKKEL